jgi:hypothetical protein
MPIIGRYRYTQTSIVIISLLSASRTFMRDKLTTECLYGVLRIKLHNLPPLFWLEAPSIRHHPLTSTGLLIHVPFKFLNNCHTNVVCTMATLLGMYLPLIPFEAVWFLAVAKCILWLGIDEGGDVTALRYGRLSCLHQAGMLYLRGWVLYLWVSASSS